MIRLLLSYIILYAGSVHSLEKCLILLMKEMSFNKTMYKSVIGECCTSKLQHYHYRIFLSRGSYALITKPSATAWFRRSSRLFMSSVPFTQSVVQRVPVRQKASTGGVAVSSA